jgi:hypothetical protein
MQPCYQYDLSTDLMQEKDYITASDRAWSLYKPYQHNYELSEKYNKGDNTRCVIPIANVKKNRDNFINRMKDALQAGDVSLARHIAMEGAEHYPSNRELQEYARVLAPPRILEHQIPANSAVRANHNWLKAHQQDYRGRWIALRHGELVGIADTLEALTSQLETTRGILLTRVP